MQYKTAFYAASNKNQKILDRSSSGGAFDAFAKVILGKGGYVIGAAFTEDKKAVKYIVCDTTDQLSKLYGSKYVQAQACSIYKKVEGMIRNSDGDVPFLITGTPCFIEGFRNYMQYLGLSLDKVYFCSLICHGVPSPRIWKEYIELRFPEVAPDKVSFKDKRYGWEKPVAIAESDGHEFSLSNYSHLFNNDLMLRPCCYECNFSTTERKCDLSIGDFWGIDKHYPNLYNRKGTSLILVHSEKGSSLLDLAREYLSLSETERKFSLQHNLMKPTVLENPEIRKKFWKYYKKNGLFKTIKRNELLFIGVRLRHRLKKLKKDKY